MRVVTLNLRSGLSLPDPGNLTPLIEFLSSLSADVICLQEVDRFLPRSRFRNQTASISKALGMQGRFFPSFPFSPFSFGLTTLSHLPFVGHRSYFLPFSNEPRVLAKSVILFEGKPCMIFNTHLGLKSDERNRQTRRISHIITPENSPFLLCGDFNEPVPAPAMASLPHKFKEVRDFAYAPTFPAFDPKVRIDLMFCSSESTFSSAFVSPVVVSDHLAFVADLELK